MQFKRVHCFIFIVLLAWFSIKCSSSATSNKSDATLTDSIYDVFIVAGQSNTYYGLGYDSILDKSAKGIYQLGRVDPNNMKIIEAKEPLQHYFTRPDRIGFALTFAKLYDTLCEHKKNILIIPCGMDWTGFADSSWKRGDCLYNDAVNRANYVFKKYAKSTMAGILWCQGEKDIGNPKFQVSLDSMIAGFRKDITAANSNTPFILGGMVPFWTEKNKERMNQQEIIKDTKNRIPFVGYADPYIPFRISKDKDSIDEYHYNAAGQREMGKRFFEAYKKIISSQKK